MNRYLHRAAFGIGLLVPGWVALASLPANPLALAVTLLIAGFFLMGAMELRRHDQATTELAQLLADTTAPPADLQAWLQRLPTSLRHAMRLRIEGERSALPGPALTPYLSGLLVLLGMLGTFLGMVVTLNGTGAALQGATDLQTMRDSLAAPVKGLGLAFGTSVAGVAASAMLGLMAALSRRARLQAAQLLDGLLATTLHLHTRAHQRQQSLQLQQQQASLMPALVAQLQTLMTRLDQQTRLSGEQQLASQQRFHDRASASYQALATSVDQSLRHSLAESARLAAATLQPAVAATMQGIAQETTALHGHIAATVQQQLDGLSDRFAAATQDITGRWTVALSDQAHAGQQQALQLQAALDGFGTRFEDRSAAWLDRAGGQFGQQTSALLETLHRSQAQQQAEQAVIETQRLAAWSAQLATVAQTLQQQWRDTGAQTAAQQAQICQTLEQTAARMVSQSETQARLTLGEIGSLVQAASAAPRAAAELVAQLREQIADSVARDHTMLDERRRTLDALNTLLQAVQHTATEQKAAIDQLVGSSAAWLQQAGSRFDEQIAAESARIESVSAQLSSSAVDVASLGEAFGTAVQLFGQSSERMTNHLQRLETTLARSITRSDEQLAYYVAQAREVIDLSISSQKQVVEDLQRIARQRDVAGSEA